MNNPSQFFFLCFFRFRCLIFRLIFSYVPPFHNMFAPCLFRCHRTFLKFHVSCKKIRTPSLCSLGSWAIRRLVTSFYIHCGAHVRGNLRAAKHQRVEIKAEMRCSILKCSGRIHVSDVDLNNTGAFALYTRNMGMHAHAYVSAAGQRDVKC